MAKAQTPQPNKSALSVGSKGFEIKNTILLSAIVIFLLCIALFGGIVSVMGIMAAAFPGLMLNIWFWLGFMFLALVGIGLPFYIGLRMMEVRAEPEQPFEGKKQTLKEIISMNSKEYAFEVAEGEGYDLVLRYKLADAKWKGILFKGGVKKGYWLYLRLDEAKKTAYCFEKLTTLSWRTGISPWKAGVSVNGNFFYGIVLFSSEKLRVFDALQGFRKVAEVKYNISNAKFPVFNALLMRGWRIKPVLFMLPDKKR